MSFELPPQQSPSRGRSRGKGGGGLFMLILMGVGIFIFMNMMRGGQRENLPQQENQRPTGNQSSEYDQQRERAYEKQREKVFGERPQEKRSRMPEKRTAGDDGWSIEDAGSNPVERRANAKKTQEGDWSIEEVDGKKKKSSSDFRLGGEGGQKVPATKTDKTKSGDWSIEEVEGKEAPKKTKKGDWTVEEVDK